MAEVIDLEEFRLGKKHGWGVFYTVCRECSHSWVGVKVNVAPFDNFECPSCGARRGEAVSKEEWDKARAAVKRCPKRNGTRRAPRRAPR